MGCASEDDGRSLEYFSAAAWMGQTAVDLETEFLVCTYTQQTGLKGLFLLKRFPIVDLSTGRMSDRLLRRFWAILVESPASEQSGQARASWDQMPLGRKGGAGE